MSAELPSVGSSITSSADPIVGRLEALLTTTFDLEPDFVERDFLPSLLRLPALDDFSHRGRMQLEVELGRLRRRSLPHGSSPLPGASPSLRLHVSAARLPSAVCSTPR